MQWKIYSISLQSPTLRVVFFNIFMVKTDKKIYPFIHDAKNKIVQLTIYKVGIISLCSLLYKSQNSGGGLKSPQSPPPSLTRPLTLCGRLPLIHDYAVLISYR